MNQVEELDDTQRPASSTTQGPLRRRFFRVVLIAEIVILGGFIVFWVAPALWSYIAGPSLPVYWKIPDFSLVERSGRQVTLADLKGKVWITNFIYVDCTDTCPFQTAEMAKLQKEFSAESDFRLLSITVDPERDTQEALSEYAQKFGADLERWLFLTGKKEAIYHLAQKGFRLSVVDPRKGKQGVDRGKRSMLNWFEPVSAYAHHGETSQPYIHSSRFVLLDRKSQVRGFYAGISAPSAAPKGKFVPVYDKEALERMRRDIRALLMQE